MLYLNIDQQIWKTHYVVMILTFISYDGFQLTSKGVKEFLKT